MEDSADGSPPPSNAQGCLPYFQVHFESAVAAAAAFHTEYGTETQAEAAAVAAVAEPVRLYGRVAEQHTVYHCIAAVLTVCGERERESGE